MAEAKRRNWVGFDLGGTKMLSAVFDSDFKILGRRRRKTGGAEGAKSGVERLITTIHDALEDGKVGAESLAGIGIGCPGYIDLDRGVIIDSANLSWKNVQLKDALEKEFGCPAVILNDVDAGVYGEYRFGSGKGARCLIGVFLGTGIGGGCVLDGNVIRGKVMSCFEIGHLQINPHGKACGCGRIGCLETEASRLSIAAQAAMAAYRGEAPYLSSLAGTDLEKIRSGMLAEAIEAGDIIVQRIVERAANLIGRAVGDVVNLLLPDIIVLGGGLVEAMPEIFVKGVEEAARERCVPPFGKTFKVAAAKLGDHAVLEGAAAWAEACLAGDEKKKK